MPRPGSLIALAAVAALQAAPAAAQRPESPEPVPLERLEYTKRLLPGASYDPDIPVPGRLLGFPLGSRPASPEEIIRCLTAWDTTSERMTVSEYARTHEGRSLFYVVLTSPENHLRLEEIRAGYAAMADPEGLAQEEGRHLVESLPAVAWLAYSIHGDETSGADASLALIYHLVASTDADVRRLLEEMVIIVDPMMNPDGRARWHQQITEHRGAMPNVDDQSLVHAGYWPWGRMNHYLFDLNRDWILGVHPETRGRIRAAASWNPLLFVDAHEMGPQDTYLFSPARHPRNPHMPGFQQLWNERFAADQAAAFDRQGWTYYTGEWNEGWYPGYSDAWASFRGAIGILYEQAGVAEDAVRRPHGALLPYMETVHHQLVSSLANLETLRSNALDIKSAFLDHRRQAASPEGPYAGRTFAVLPTANTGRRLRFLDLMHLQGIRVYEADRDFTAPAATDHLGRRQQRVALPQGTLLIPNRQPLAHLVATMLEFDTRMTSDYLARERRELLKRGRSSIYDVTAWNITMMYGMESLTLESDLPPRARLLDPETPPPGRLEGAAAANAWIVDGEDDRSVALAARLLEAGVEVRVADRPFEFEERRYARGSVVVLASDNAAVGLDAARLRSKMEPLVAGSGLTAVGAVSGLGEGELPDIGGRHFRLLEPPRVALVARGRTSGYDFGAIWHMLDRSIGIRHSHIPESRLRTTDLRRYNVLVVPHRWSGKLPEDTIPGLRQWVESGGTLVAIGDATSSFTGKEAEASRVRSLPDALEDLDKYELALQRQWMAQSGQRPPDTAVWTHVAAAVGDEPWTVSAPPSRPALEDLKARDAWQRQFMPRGAFLAGDVDQEHWLTFGAGEILPILTATYPVLMAAEGVEVPVRFGTLAPGPGATPGSGEPGDGRLGWVTLPPEHEIRLRMSGLLWPEGGERIANSAFLTRESKGSGQIILFSAPPVFRGSTLGTARLLANALVYGPGLGASQPVEP